MLGQAWPAADVAIAIFSPDGSDRKPSWASGLANGNWYVGGGHRLQIAGSHERSIQAIEIDAFRKHTQRHRQEKSVLPARRQVALRNRRSKSGASLHATAAPSPLRSRDSRSRPLRPRGERAAAGRSRLAVPPRVDGQVGIFSVEYTLPGLIRTMQFGVATVRLPVFRLEVHTDGGFLADLGYPWNNDFSRSCQVEVAIFLGSGGFYFGRTSAAAADLLRFDGGGYGYLPPDDAALDRISTLRLGVRPARVGIGRSLTIPASSRRQHRSRSSGSLEGAAGYRAGADFFSPTPCMRSRASSA